MENKLEQLLNSFIEKGWKPRGKDYAEVLVYDGIIRFERRFGADCIETFRTLTSKESGLWQFVCENGLIPEDKMGHERLLDLTFGPYGPEVKAQMHSRTYEYRLIESSLKDESELEDFLLNNIKVEGIS